MEEDIKLLEEFINYKNIIDTPYHLIAISHERLCEAIENLIQSNKELKVENEKLKYLLKKATKIIDEYTDEMENDTKKIIEYREKYLDN